MSCHGMPLLRIAIGHLRHARSRHAAKTTTHTAVAPHRAAATGRVATTRTIIGGLVNTDRTSVESVALLVSFETSIVKRKPTAIW